MTDIYEQDFPTPSLYERNDPEPRLGLFVLDAEAVKSDPALAAIDDAQRAYETALDAMFDASGDWSDIREEYQRAVAARRAALASASDPSGVPPTPNRDDYEARLAIESRRYGALHRDAAQAAKRVDAAHDAARTQLRALASARAAALQEEANAAITHAEGLLLGLHGALRKCERIDRGFALKRFGRSLPGPVNDALEDCYGRRALDVVMGVPVERAMNAARHYAMNDSVTRRISDPLAKFGFDE